MKVNGAKMFGQTKNLYYLCSVKQLNKNDMKTYKIYEITPTTVEEIGEFTNAEYKQFRQRATRLFERMCEINPNLTILNGVWSVHLWDEIKHTTVLTYNAEIIASDYKL